MDTSCQSRGNLAIVLLKLAKWCSTWTEFPNYSIAFCFLFLSSLSATLSSSSSSSTIINGFMLSVGCGWLSHGPTSSFLSSHHSFAFHDFSFFFRSLSKFDTLLCYPTENDVSSQRIKSWARNGSRKLGPENLGSEWAFDSQPLLWTTGHDSQWDPTRNQ